MFQNDIPKFGEVYSYDNVTPWIARKPKQNQVMVVQSGNGLEDVKTALDFGADLLKAAEGLSDLTFGPVGTNISNTLSEVVNKNEEWKPGFAGEKHLILPTDKGLTRANFAGPGTHLEKRLARGDKGVDGPNGIDNAAKKHDIAYANAKSYKDIRMADKTFMNDVKNSTQSKAVKAAVIGAMKAKNFAEDIGVLGKDKYLTEAQKAEFSGNGLNIVEPVKQKKKLTPAELLLKKYGRNKKVY